RIIMSYPNCPKIMPFYNRNFSAKQSPVIASSGQGNSKPDGGALHDDGVEARVAIESQCSLAHTHPSKSGFIAHYLGVETLAVICHGNMENVCFAAQTHFNAACLRMTGDIGERFLQHPKYSGRSFIVQ